MPEVTDAIKQLRQDPGVEEAFEHRIKTAIPEHIEYFFGMVHRFTSMITSPPTMVFSEAGRGPSSHSSAASI
jgi:hypothetical protein